jgi:hypothetical protein
MGGKDKKDDAKAKAKAQKREAARKKKERIINMTNKVREMEDMNLKIEVDYQDVVNKNKEIITELKDTKQEIVQCNVAMDQLMVEQDEEVGEIQAEEEEEKPDKADGGDQTPR